MSQSAENLFDEIGAALAPAFSNPATAVVALSAALLGGLFGAWARGAPPPAERRPRPEGARRAQAAQRRGEDGMIFRGEGGQRGDVPRAPRRPSAESGEAARLFSFFEERFGLTDRSASAAIAFFTQLSQSIEDLRHRAEAAERNRMAGGAGQGASPEEAAWRMLSDGMRLCRSVLQNQGEADPELERFEHVTELEEVLINLGDLRAQSQNGEQPIDPRLIEQAWPHALFRAEALLQAYYPGHGAWGDLCEGVTLMAAALRRLLRSVGVSVVGARLLTSYTADEGEQWTDSADELADLEQVRARLMTPAKEGRRSLVIDCERFGHQDAKSGQISRSKLVLLNPADWR